MLHSVRESLVTFTGRGDDEIPDPELPIHSTPASWARNAKSKMISFMSRHPESFESIAFSIAGEFLATFMFMFLIEAPFINNARQLQPENLALECIVVGFSAAGMIYTFYEISGGHLNPIITFSMMISGKMNWLKGIYVSYFNFESIILSCVLGFLYILTQLLASAFATLYLSLVFPPMPGDLLSIPERLSLSYYPGTATHTGFWMELTLSFILIFTVFSTMDPGGGYLCPML